MEEIKTISEQDNPALVRQNSQLRYSKLQSNVVILDKSVNQWRYSFHPKSIFSNWFGMRLGMTLSLSPFKKHYTCGHTFGCMESMIRVAAKTVALWLFTKGALSLLFGFDLQREVISLL